MGRPRSLVLGGAVLRIGQELPALWFGGAGRMEPRAAALQLQCRSCRGSFIGL